MRSSIIVLATLLATFSCCPCKHLATGTTDSVTTRIVERIERIRDTVMVQLPAERVDNTTADTTSYLETSYAVSTAAIRNGSLHHSIWNKTTPVGVVVNLDFKVQDVTKERLFKVTNTVEVQAELSWWQETQIKGFRVLALIALAFIGWKFRRPLMALLKL